jgi:hypothetical protein
MQALRNPDINHCEFHLVRGRFDVQAFGVNAANGNAGDEMIEEHHEANDEENRTNGHEELFAVMTGHEVFTRVQVSPRTQLASCTSPEADRRTIWAFLPRTRFHEPASVSAAAEPGSVSAAPGLGAQGAAVGC